MKTLIVLLAAALASPAFAQSSGTTTTDTTYSRDTNYSNSNSTLSNPSLSGSSTDATTADSATMSPTAPASPTAAPNTSTSLSPSTTTDTTASSLSPNTTSSETTSRTYKEEAGYKDRKMGGLFLEPAIFGSREDVDIKGNLAGADNTGTSNGFGADLKLGAHAGEIFFIGADGRYERSRFADTSYSNVDGNTWNVGPVVGLQMPFMGARAWGTYVLDGNSDPEAGARGVDLKFKDPYGWRVGAGIRLSSVSLNLEYEDLTYRTTEIESVGDVATGTNTGVDFGQRGYTVSLSFPIEL